MAAAEAVRAETNKAQMARDRRGLVGGSLFMEVPDESHPYVS